VSPGGSDRPPEERIRTLLLRGDNVMKNQGPESLARALAAFEEARGVARERGVEPRLGELVERRIESLEALMAAGR
jgi:hypothetical protein